jgi:PAS domain S-box-containing protein
MEDEDNSNSVLKRALKDLRKRIKKYGSSDSEFLQPSEYVIKYKEHLEELIEEQSNELYNFKEILLKGNDKYQRVFEASPESIIILDTDGRIIDCNENTSKIIGLDKEKIIGKSFSKLGLIEKKDLKKYIKIFSALSEDNELKPLEINVISSNNQEQWFEVFPSPIAIDDKVVGIQIITRDITARKKSEEELKNSEKQYRLLVENNSDIVWIMNMVLQTTYSSPAVEQILGYTPDEIMKKSLFEILTPDSMETAEEVLKKELIKERKKNSNPNRSGTMEIQAKHKNGSIVWLEARMSFIRNAKGNPIGIIGTSRDITARKEIEFKHKESEIRYQTLIENITEVIVEIDLDGNLIFVSPQVFDTIGFEPDEIMGKNAFEFIHPDDYDLFTHTLRKMVSENKRISVEYKILHKKGHYVPVSTYGKLVEDNGKIRIIGVVRQTE